MSRDAGKGAPGKHECNAKVDPSGLNYYNLFREALMKKISLHVQKEFCDECSLAIRRFVGKMDGVNSVDMEDGKIVITIDDSKILEADILKISRESVEKLGYKILD